jgi:xanthine dehydrogenase accessory factor
MDDRAEFANRQRYPEANTIKVLDNFDNCFPELGTDDFVVIVTRGHQYDRDVLAQALKTKAGYIGMIGSKRKREAIYRSLLQEGFTELDLQRVYSPIGLDIGSDTPQEIGMSIVAELVKARAEKVR